MRNGHNQYVVAFAPINHSERKPAQGQTARLVTPGSANIGIVFDKRENAFYFVNKIRA